MLVLFVVVFVGLAKRVYTSIGLWGLYHENKNLNHKTKEPFIGRDNVIIGFF